MATNRFYSKTKLAAVHTCIKMYQTLLHHI